MNSTNIRVTGATDTGPEDQRERWRRYGAELNAGIGRRKGEAPRHPPLWDGRHDPLMDLAVPGRWQGTREAEAWQAGYRAGCADGWNRAEAVYAPAMPEGAR